LARVCFWEDDGQGKRDADLVRGGPNAHLGLPQTPHNTARLIRASWNGFALPCPKPGGMRTGDLRPATGCSSDDHITRLQTHGDADHFDQRGNAEDKQVGTRSAPNSDTPSSTRAFRLRRESASAVVSPPSPPPTIGMGSRLATTKIAIHDSYLPPEPRAGREGSETRKMAQALTRDVGRINTWYNVAPRRSALNSHGRSPVFC
jgi:hypothetical protein